MHLRAIISLSPKGAQTNDLLRQPSLRARTTNMRSEENNKHVLTAGKTTNDLWKQLMTHLTRNTQSLLVVCRIDLGGRPYLRLGTYALGRLRLQFRRGDSIMCDVFWDELQARRCSSSSDQSRPAQAEFMLPRFRPRRLPQPQLLVAIGGGS